MFTTHIVTTLGDYPSRPVLQFLQFIGISIWFEMFVPFSQNSLDPDCEVQSTRSTLALNMAAERESLQGNTFSYARQAS